MGKYLICILLFGILISCSKKDSDLSPKEKDTSVNNLTHVKDFDKIFELVNTIELETTDKCIVGIPYNIEISSKYIIINDPVGSKTVLVFDKAGRFIKNVGKIGGGPGEYRAVESIEESNDSLYVYDPMSYKIDVYNLEAGTFLTNWNVNNYFQNICKIRNSIILLSYSSVKYNEESAPYVYNIKGKMEYKIELPASPTRHFKKHIIGNSSCIAKSDDKLLYVGADDYRIICYNLNSRKTEWLSEDVSQVIRLPREIPDTKKIKKWMSENYPRLRALLALTKGLIIINASDYFLMYDKYGNYLNKISVSRDNFYRTDGEYLYEYVWNNNGNAANNGTIKIYIPKI